MSDTGACGGDVRRAACNDGQQSSSMYVACARACCLFPAHFPVLTTPREPVCTAGQRHVLCFSTYSGRIEYYDTSPQASFGHYDILDLDGPSSSDLLPLFDRNDCCMEFGETWADVAKRGATKQDLRCQQRTAHEAAVATLQAAGGGETAAPVAAERHTPAAAAAAAPAGADDATEYGDDTTPIPQVHTAAAAQPSSTIEPAAHHDTPAAPVAAERHTPAAAVAAAPAGASGDSNSEHLQNQTTDPFPEMLFGEPYSLLSHGKLGQYSERFIELGYDSASDLLDLNEDEVCELATLVRMLPGHLVRLKKLLHKAREQANSTTTGSY